MSSVEALSSGDITKVGVIVIVALVVIGVLLSLLITAVIARIIIVIVVVALSVVVWQQRTHIKDKFDKCDTRATFFGVHLDAPQSIKDKCRRLHG
jgi:protein-S-isoprenylcysteine O-methyltransferase Ste14